MESHSTSFLQSKIEEANGKKAFPDFFEASDSSNLSKDFSSLLEDDSFCDYTIIVGSGSVPFKCHKAVLCCRSSFFKTLFLGGMMDDSQECSLQKPNLSPEIFSKILGYMYTGQIQISSNHLFDLYCCADELGITALTTQICESVLKSFETNAILDILEQTISFSASSLHSACATALAANGQRALTNPKFGHLKKETVEYIIKTCKFNCQEIDVLKACINWSKIQSEKINQSEQHQLATSASTSISTPLLPLSEIQKFLLVEIAPHIKLNLIGANDLRDIVEACGVFAEREIGEAYRHQAIALASKEELKLVRADELKQQMEIIVSEMDDRTTKITWIYPDFRGTGDKRLFSEPFMAKGKWWKLMIRVKPPDAFGLYISIETSKWGPGESYRMGYSLSILNQVPTETIARTKFERMFGPPNDSLWGFDGMSSTSLVTNPHEGFLVNGTLRVEATMIARE